MAKNRSRRLRKKMHIDEFQELGFSGIFPGPSGTIPRPCTWKAWATRIATLWIWPFQINPSSLFRRASGEPLLLSAKVTQKHF